MFGSVDIIGDLSRRQIGSRQLYIHGVILGTTGNLTLTLTATPSLTVNLISRSLLRNIERFQRMLNGSSVPFTNVHN